MMRRLAGMYFVIQAVAVVAWWAVLVAAPSTQSYFTMRDAPFATLGSFAPGDLGLLALGSSVVGIRMGRGWTIYLAWAVSGALLYAAGYTVTAAASGVSSPVGALLMVPAALASIAASVTLSPHAPADTLSSSATP